MRIPASLPPIRGIVQRKNADSTPKSTFANYAPSQTAFSRPIPPVLQQVYFGAEQHHRMAVNVRGERVTPLTYPVLQGLPHLEAARESAPTPMASADSTVKTILQAVEIGLWNSVDLTLRATADIQNGDIDQAANKMEWLEGINEVLGRVSQIANSTAREPQQSYRFLRITDSKAYQALEEKVLRSSRIANSTAKAHQSSYHVLHITDSDAYRTFIKALENFNQAIEEKELDIETGIQQPELHPHLANLSQQAMEFKNNLDNWARRLATIRLQGSNDSFDHFIGADSLKQAVFGLHLQGKEDDQSRRLPQTLASIGADSLNDAVLALRLQSNQDNRFTQFRGLHQIPELLCAEANDHLRKAIEAVQANRPIEAARRLMVVNKLVSRMYDSIKVLSTHLTLPNYHEIRAALEETSGSHSISIRAQLFTKLYHDLGIALLAKLARLPSEEIERALKEDIRAEREKDFERTTKPLVNRIKASKMKAWQITIDSALDLRDGIQAWRDKHITFPKRFLGGESRSLMGAYGIKSADNMRKKGTQYDALSPIAQYLGLSTHSELWGGNTPLRNSTLHNRIDVATAERTRRLFDYVEDRRGKNG